MRSRSWTVSYTHLALYGYFGYETAALFQPKLAQTIPPSSAESCLVLAGTVIVFDHLYNRLDVYKRQSPE